MVFLLASPVPSRSATSDVPPSVPPPEVLCGFVAGPHHYYEAREVKRGLAVDMFVGNARPGQPVTLRFFINFKPHDNPIDRLQLEHERLVHVIGVRDDLRHFFHVHPTRISPGFWAVTLTFTNAGNYKIWTDVKYEGVSYAFGQPLLTVPGPLSDIGEDAAPAATVVTSGYRLTLNHSEPLVAGRTNQLQFLLQDPAGHPTATTNYLGAPMHLVIVKDDLTTCLHAHPDHLADLGSSIFFKQVFSSEGTYKLFAQFRPKNAGLGPDDPLLAEFYVRVVKDAAPAIGAVAHTP